MCIIQIHFVSVYYSSTLCKNLLSHLAWLLSISLKISDTMASRGPLRKRMKTTKGSQVAPSPNMVNTSDGQSVQDFLAALVPALIPAITEGVVTSLQDLGVINKPTSQNEQSSADQT